MTLVSMTEDDQAPFQDRLSRFRKAQGLSFQALGDKIGAAPYVVRRWELGTSKPDRNLANKLSEIGFGPIADRETNASSRSRIKTTNGSSLSEPIFRDLNLTSAGLPEATPPAWAINGPPDQDAFYLKMLRLQLRDAVLRAPLDRLSLVDCYAPGKKTLQSLLEAPKAKAASWNSNYGSHGWHRYVGRFPPHVIRALLNHFGLGKNSVVCDPFSGSGTTAVECRLLGIPFVGIEIGALSHLMGKVKATFDADPAPLVLTAKEYRAFADKRTHEFKETVGSNFSVADVLARPNNPVASFQNIEKWFTAEAFLGVSIAVEFAKTRDGFLKDAVLLALSAKMRSIGNVDVDVVRAEYSKSPRDNVDVGRLVYRQLLKMAENIDSMTRTHGRIIGDLTSIRLIEGSALSVDLPEASIDAVITSPPYGVEALSYLRTHLLSYRSLASELDHDPYEIRDQTVGSEYLEESILPSELNVAAASETFREFFEALPDLADKKSRQRRAGMIKFFEDMHTMGERLAHWLKDGGRVAWIIGNKRLGDAIIPTDKIIEESFSVSGLKLYDIVRHKLKTNNSNSQVPWQERIIQEEAVMLFERSPRS